jgi:hypothetical protein
MTGPLLLAGLLLGAPASPAPSAAGSRIMVEPTRVDFGRVLTQRTVTRSVQVRNAGQVDLVIERVSSSCDCTVARDYDTVVKPGRSTTLKVSLDTREAPGRVVRSLLIHSNDPTRSQVEVKLEATVVVPGPR